MQRNKESKPLKLLSKVTKQNEKIWRKKMLTWKFPQLPKIGTYLYLFLLSSPKLLIVFCFAFVLV